eukprot:2464923-Pyramimonas_sp.AAC.1
MDPALMSEVQQILGQPLADATQAKAFVAAAAGGLGFQSAALTAPSAQAASWHLCLPRCLGRLELAGASALAGASPWASTCLPAATRVLQATLDDQTAH